MSEHHSEDRNLARHDLDVDVGVERCGAADRVAQNDASVPQRELRPALLAEKRETCKVQSWGPASPSTIEVYLDRWTHYFATDPCWYSVYRVTRGESEPDPLAHHAFCRDLAAKLVATFVATSGAPAIKSWGPAPPSTIEDYTASWGSWFSALFAPKDVSNSTSQPTIVAPVSAIPEDTPEPSPPPEPSAPPASAPLVWASPRSAAPISIAAPSAITSAAPSTRASPQRAPSARGSNRIVSVTTFVGVAEIEVALGCKQSTAYEHLRRAARRPPGTRGLLRVPLAQWETYAAETFTCQSSFDAEKFGTGSSGKTARAGCSRPAAPIRPPPRQSSVSASGPPPIPITHARRPAR